MKVIVALGVALRVADYLRRTSLNIDESRIALNIGLRSYAALFPPLDQAQSAPVLFLWAEKLVVDVLGWSELTLRAIPLLAGIATVVLMVPVARRLAPPRAALLAVALVACAPGLVHFSAVLKQYSLDAMCSVLLLRLFLVWREPSAPRSAWPLFVAVGAAVLWASAPVVFVVVGAWLAILLLARRGAVPWSKAWTAAAVWGASFALVFQAVYRDAAEDPYLHHFWAPAFVRPFDLASLGNAAGDGALDGVGRADGDAALHSPAGGGLGRLLSRDNRADHRRGPWCMADWTGATRRALPCPLRFSSPRVRPWPVSIRWCSGPRSSRSPSCNSASPSA